MTVHMRPYIKDDIELDQIAVQGIRVKGYHGVLDTEREGGQVFFADVVAHVNSRVAAARDDVAHTVNYSDMADRTAEVLAGSPSRLIEAVAEQVARALLDMQGVECVDVTVHKPHAPLHVEFKDVTVTIRRDLTDGNLWADKRIGSSAGQSDDQLDTGATPVRDAMDVRPAQPVGAHIALGGNLGDVEPTFREVLAELHRVTGVEVQSASPLVRTAPEGGADQPDYLNAVVRVHTSLAPRELLAACHGIEMLHGRDRTVPGSARTLDLDLVSYEGVVGTSEDLTLPHPRAHLRNFVLLPWSHMEPEAVLEPHGRVVDLARQAGLDGVRMVSTEWPRVPAADALAGPSVQADVAPVVASSAGEPAVAQQPVPHEHPVPSEPPLSTEQPVVSPPPVSAEQPVSGHHVLHQEVPDRLSPYSPVADVNTSANTERSRSPESPFAPESAFAPERTAEPDANTVAPTPVWSPVEQPPVNTSPGAASKDDVPSFSVPSAQSQSAQPQSGTIETRPTDSPATGTQPPQPEVSPSAESPAHRPSVPEAQPGVPRRASFGVARQHAESPIWPANLPEPGSDETR